MDGIAGVMTKIFYQNKPLKLVIMNKKLKIAYWVVMGLLAAVCIVNIIKDCHLCVAISGVSVVWLAVCYVLAKTICEQEAEIKDWMNEYYSMKDSLDKELCEALAREKRHHQELAKMRERAQNAEKQLQQMIDDTPARGKDGRYVKREIE